MEGGWHSVLAFAGSTTQIQQHCVYKEAEPCLAKFPSCILLLFWEEIQHKICFCCSYFSCWKFNSVISSPHLQREMKANVNGQSRKLSNKTDSTCHVWNQVAFFPRLLIQAVNSLTLDIHSHWSAVKSLFETKYAFIFFLQSILLAVFPYDFEGVSCNYWI